jgi:hypothetical protein
VFCAHSEEHLYECGFFSALSLSYFGLEGDIHKIKHKAIHFQVAECNIQITVFTATNYKKSAVRLVKFQVCFELTHMFFALCCSYVTTLAAVAKTVLF